MTATYIDLFSGAGGLSLGLESVGMKCLLAADIWADAMSTFRRNFPGTPTWEDDVRKLDRFRLETLLEQTPEWVVGGAPCQGFSTVGKRERTDPRNNLVREFVRVVSILRPTGFVLENVLGLKDMKFVEPIVAEFRALGYDVQPTVVTSADFGVPQLRRRILFIGSLDGIDTSSLSEPRPREYRTVWDAIGDLPELEPGESAEAYDRRARTPYQKLMRAGSRTLQGHVASNHPAHLVKAISFIPDGGNRTAIPTRHQPRSGFHNSYARLHSKSPAVAVTQNMGKPSATRCVHPFQDRGLTAREGARLQSFPDTFHVMAGVTSQRVQIANAVPPLLGAAIGKMLQGNAHTSTTQDPALAAITA